MIDFVNARTASGRNFAGTTKRLSNHHSDLSQFIRCQMSGHRRLLDDILSNLPVHDSETFNLHYRKGMAESARRRVRTRMIFQTHHLWSTEDSTKTLHRPFFILWLGCDRPRPPDVDMPIGTFQSMKARTRRCECPCTDVHVLAGCDAEGLSA